jgi:gas vesicle protein
MPIPIFLIGVAVITSVAGLAKGGEAVIKNSEAKELLEDAQYIFDKKKNELEDQRKKTTGELEKYGELKIRIWDKQFKRFINLFGKIKNVKIEGEVEVDSELRDSLTAEELSEMKQLSLTAGEIVSGGIASLGTGALAGVASYGGAMMFASASTGTAIASLTGVAATNATLAWFGGGSLAVGGLGMAGGTLVLGGLVAGPVLAVGGLLMAAKAKANLAEAKAKYREAEAAIEKMQNALLMLHSIENLTDQYYRLAYELNKALSYTLDELDKMISDFTNSDKRGFLFKLKKSFLGIFGKVSGIEYDELSQEEKKVLHIASQIVQLTKVVLEKPLLDDEGSVNIEAEKYIEETDFGNMIEGV